MELIFINGNNTKCLTELFNSHADGADQRGQVENKRKLFFSLSVCLFHYCDLALKEILICVKPKQFILILFD